MPILIVAHIRGTPSLPNTITSEHDQAEIRLMGLILMQSLSIGMAVGIFDAKLWLVHSDTMINGMTYAMGAFAVQGLAYYTFKMFFQQGMDERAKMAQMERERRTKYTSMHTNFEQRRQDMELRMQEQQLDMEIRWMEHNPGKTPPWLEGRMMSNSLDTTGFMPETSEDSLELGIDFNDADDKKRDTSGKFVKKAENKEE
jgi:hypothetical protein